MRVAATYGHAMYMPSGITVLATLTEFASSSAGTFLVITGALAGGFRSWAVLRRFSADQVERMTALGSSPGLLQ